MITPPVDSQPSTQGPRWLITLVLLVVLGGVATALLETGLGDEVVVEYDDGLVEIAAIDELSARGIDPCRSIGAPALPSDLATGLEGTECLMYDTTAGLVPVLVGLAVLGAVIVITSGNRFGLYLMWVAVVTAGSGMGAAYAARAFLRPGSLPLADVVNFLAAPSWIIVGVLLVPRMILVFPTGMLPSPRWRLVARATWLPASLLIVVQWFSPLWGPLDMRNPLPVELEIEQAIGLLDIGYILWIALVMASFAGLLWRFVTARGEERQQLKWVALAVALAVVVNVLSTFIDPLTGTAQQIANFVILPTAVLFSIFKFRLYDIDRIINRTVVYGLVTLALAGLFAAVIVFPQTLLIGTQALEPGFVIVVALATLVVAAVFNPLRRQIQYAVDRRFNRTRFDAYQLVDALQKRLNEPSDVDTLMRDVSSAVETTMEPSHLAVWLPGAQQ